jgi:hypothetical protein
VGYVGVRAELLSTEGPCDGGGHPEGCGSLDEILTKSAEHWMVKVIYIFIDNRFDSEFRLVINKFCNLKRFLGALVRISCWEVS